MDVGVAVLLGLVEARAAGEDEVGAVDQLLLELEQMLRRERNFDSSSIAS